MIRPAMRFLGLCALAVVGGFAAGVGIGLVLVWFRLPVNLL